MYEEKKGPVAADPAEILNEANNPADLSLTKKINESKSSLQREKVYEIATSAFDFFKDKNGIPYARHSADRAIYALESAAFKRKIFRLHKQKDGSPPAQTSVEDAVYSLVADIDETSNTEEVFRRVGFANGRIYFDLANGKYVNIGPEGWALVETCPINFIRSKIMLPLPEPAPKGDLHLLRKNLALENESLWQLLSGWLLGAICPTHPCAALILGGEQGSGKTVLAKMIKALIDPESLGLLSPFRNEQDLFICAQNRWVLGFDNLSGVGNAGQDALCRIISGAGISARKLYSDNDESSLSARNPVLMNGIDDIATRPDLAERSICLNLPTMPQDRRRPEKLIWEEFNETRPAILAGLFDAASVALRRLKDVVIENPPRMADFAHFVTAGESGLGIPDGGFVAAFEANQEQTNSIGFESYPAIETLVTIISGQYDGSLEGTSSDLLEMINKKTEGQYDLKRHPGWPKSAQLFSSQIQRVAPLLRKRGIHSHQSRSSTERKWAFRIEGPHRAPKPSSSSLPSRPSYRDDTYDACDDVRGAWEAANERG